MFVDTDFLAEFFDVNKRTIQLWAKDSINPMPKNDRDEYNLIEVVKWRIKKLESKITEQEQGDPTLYRMKIEGEQLRNAERALKLQKLQGQLVDVAMVKVAWTNETALFRRNGESLKANLDIALIGLVPEDKRDEAREMIRTEVRKYLEQLGELRLEEQSDEEVIQELNQLEENNDTA